MALLAFVHGLRWHSAVVGQVMEKPYAMGGLEYILGPCLTLACAWAVLLRRPGASPQRTSCQFLIPIAAAILPVSYTHLDVYKRQGSNRGQPGTKHGALGAGYSIDRP